MYFVPHTVLKDKTKRQALMDDMVSFLGLDGFDWRDDGGHSVLDTDKINTVSDHDQFEVGAQHVRSSTLLHRKPNARMILPVQHACTLACFQKVHRV